MSIGLSILSWRGAEALTVSLESYAETDLFSLFDETQIFLPDPDAAVLNITKAYPIQVKTEPQNLGIMENMARAAACISCDYILMLENDCPIIESLAEAERQITKSLALLQNDNVIMARLRSVRHPGQAFPGLGKYQKLFSDTFAAKLKRLTRPDKAQRLTGYALYDSHSPALRHPNYFHDAGDGFHLVDASVMPWTNQSILIHRETFLNQILPIARNISTSRGANRLPNLEVELNKAKGWRQSGWKVACGPGLFTHERVGERGYV